MVTSLAAAVHASIGTDAVGVKTAPAVVGCTFADFLTHILKNIVIIIHYFS